MNLTITVAVISGLAALSALLGLIFARVRRRLERHIRDKFEGRALLGATTRANLFGLRSEGLGQIRGNGALVLTEDSLYFARAVPFREYTIPVERITGVSMPSGFLGKSVGRKLLCVHFDTGNGPDEAAWAVKSPERWKQSLEALVSGSLPGTDSNFKDKA